MKITNTTIAAGISLLLAAPAYALDAKLIAPRKAVKGEEIRVCVKTEADAECKIEAKNVGFSQSLKLLERKANKNGKSAR